MNELERQLLEIAKNVIPALENHVDFEMRENDDYDFFETSIMSLKFALVDAMKLGYKLGLKDSNSVLQPSSRPGKR